MERSVKTINLEIEVEDETDMNEVVEAISYGLKEYKTPYWLKGCWETDVQK